jgi:RHS repeat-associated protein
MNWNPFRRPLLSRRSSSRRRKPYRLMFEELEKRVLLATLQFGSAAYSVKQTAGIAIIDVQLVGPSTQTVTVDYQTSDGTALAGIDYLTRGGTLTFPPATTEQDVTVPLLDANGSGATAASFDLSLSQPANAVLGDPSTAVLTILENPGNRGLSATEGQAFNGVVGGLAAAPASGKVVINWGDGGTSDGTLTPNARGGDDVSGKHTYAERGHYALSVTDDSGRALGLGNHVTVADAPLTPQDGTFTATEGQASDAIVARFTDANPAASAGDFAAVITWGDGQTSDGRVVADASGGSSGTAGSPFVVRGQHAYAEAGSYSVLVRISDRDGASALAASSATVADAALTTPRSGGPVPGGASVRVVAQFRDANPASAIGDFASTLDWGDGSTSAGQVRDYGGGVYEVEGTHSYAGYGPFVCLATVQDHEGSTVTAGCQPVPTADNAILGTGQSFQVTEGTPWSGTVASFTFANQLATAAGFAATIDWGDGSTSAGEIDPSPGGGFDVRGSHRFDEQGAEAIIVWLADPSGAESEVAAASAVVLDAALSASGTTLVVHARESGWVSDTVASFTDDNPLATPDDFTALIDWSDGWESGGLILAAGSDGDKPRFEVRGTHAYAEEGTYPLAVTIRDGASRPLALVGSAVVAEVPVTVNAWSGNAFVGLPFKGVVGTFDAGGYDRSSLSATIDWGDGTTSVGIIAVPGDTSHPDYPTNAGPSTGPPGTFAVLGTHTYTSAPSNPPNPDFVTQVTVTEAGGGSQAAAGLIAVGVLPDPYSPSAYLVLTVQHVELTEGQAFAGTVATFTDSLPNDPADHLDPGRHYLARIDWGDGSYDWAGDPNNGFVPRVAIDWSDGAYVIRCDASYPLCGHEYPEEGRYTVSVTLFESDYLWDTGQQLLGTVSAADSWKVSEADFGRLPDPGPQHSTVAWSLPSVQGSGTSLSGTAGQPLGSVTVATFTGPAGLLSTYHVSATIAWGDGTTSTVPLQAASGSATGYQVVADHTYAHPGQFTARIALTAGANTLALAATPVDVAPAAPPPPPAAGQRFTVTEGQAFTDQVVATLVGDSCDCGGPFTATIAWGDGGTSAATIRPAPAPAAGSQVLGSHQYATPGAYPVVVTLTDLCGRTSGAYATALVTPARVVLTARDVTVPALGSIAYQPAFGPALFVDGSMLPGMVIATITDANPLASASSFGLPVWGDGGAYGVAGGHGLFYVLADFASGAAPPAGSAPVVYTATGSVWIAPVGGLTQVVPQTTTYLPAAAGLIGPYDFPQFYNDNPCDMVLDETLDWGDGTTPVDLPIGITTPALPPPFPDGSQPPDGLDNAFHVYAHEDTYTPAATVQWSGGESLFGTRTLDVADAPLVSLGFLPVTGAEGQDLGGPPLLVFGDSDPNSQAGAFTVTIAWGDGSTSTATAVALPDGTFAVPGQHSYAEAGYYPIVIEVDDPGGATLAGTTWAEIADPDLTAQGGNVFGLAGLPTGDVVVATGADAAAPPGDYRAVIDWGDGSTSLGELRASAARPGDYQVVGNHTYAAAGSYPIRTAIDEDTGSVVAVGRAQVTALWLLSGRQPGNDPDRALLLPLGEATVAPNTGGLRLSHPLDFDQNPGTDIGGNPALVYNSDTVDVRPVLQLLVDGVAKTVPQDPPQTISVQLTWAQGTPQDWVTFTPGPQPPSDGYLLAVQVHDPVAQTGRYPWQALVRLDFGSGQVVQGVLSGTADVVVADDPTHPDALGAGWGIAGVDALVPTCGGVLDVTGAGDSRFFADNGDGTFTGPAEDSGTLVQHPDGSYTYTARGQTVTTFDPRGLLLVVQDRDGLRRRYQYDAGGRLVQVTAPDGGVTTFAYAGSGVAITEPGNQRVVRLGLGGANDLVSIADADAAASVRTFTYDGSHHVVRDQWAPLDASFTYSPTTGALVRIDRGLGSTYDVTAAATQGLTGPALAWPPQASVTDGLGATTRYTLDGRGRTLEVVQPLGNTETIARDASGNVVRDTDPLGLVTSYVYSNGDLVEVDHPDGTSDRYRYDSTFHQQTSHSDRLGNTTTYQIDSSTGDLLASTNPLGNTTTYYWRSGLLTGTLDANQGLTVYTYDSSRRLVTATDPPHQTTTTTYDANGNPATVTDSLQHTVQTSYDGANRLLETIDGDKGPSYNYYDAEGNVTETVDPDGNPTYNYYDVAGRLTESIDADGKASYTYYNPDGRVTMTVDADGKPSFNYYDLDGNLTETVDGNRNPAFSYYDADGRMTETIDADGARSYQVRDSNGRVIESVDGMGRVTRMDYDADGRTIAVVDALGQVTGTLYDANGHATETIDPHGYVSFTYYDAVGNVTGRVDASGHLTQALYNLDGQVTETVDARGKASYSYFDADGNVTMTVDADGRPSYSYFDADGNVTMTVDANGKASYRYFDPDGRVTETIDADGKPSFNYFDADGNLTMAVDANGKRSYSYYDPNGQLTETVDADGNRSFDYLDANGNVTETVDANGKPSYRYFDPDGRVTMTVDADGRASCRYFDADGNLTESIDADGKASYRYFDPDGRLTMTVDADGKPSYITYDANGQVTETVDARGKASFDYLDPNGNVTETVDANGKPSFDYLDADGNVTETVDANGKPSYSYFDPDGRVTMTIDADGRPSYRYFDANSNVTETIDANGKPSYSYFDPDGRLTMTVDADGRASYTYYDANGQATETVDANGKPSFDYLDANGNVTETVDANGKPSFSYFDPDGRVTMMVDADGRPSYRYFDADGNLTETVDANGKPSYSYFDPDGRLTMTVDADGNASYTYYDGNGQVTGTVDANGKPSFDYLDPNGNVTETVDANGKLSYRYFDSDGRATMTVDADGKASYSYFDADGQLTETVDANGNPSFDYLDPNGNVTETVDADGKPSYSYFDADGRITMTVDADGKPSYTYYDRNGQVTEAVDANGALSFDYLDANGNVTETVDANGKPSYRYFDPDGRVTMTVDADGRPSYSYFDADGHLTETIDANGKASYSYFDGDGRVTMTVDADGNPSYTYYDANGQVTETVDANGKPSFDYLDPNGNVTETVDANGKASYSYFDADGRVTMTVDADGRPSYRYIDADGNVTETIDANGKPSYSYYDANGQATETIDANGKPSYSYFDPDGRVTMTVDAHGRPSYSYFDADGRLTETIDADGKASYRYFDADGRVTMSVDADGKPSYTYYDANGQVTETIDGDGKPSFEYLDPNGNVTETVDANGKPSYRYFDPDGQVTMTVDADGRPSYRYFDANGNVTETIDADGKPSYRYFDPDGRVTMTVDADGKTSYTYYDANGQVTETVDANGRPSFDYFDPNGNVTETVDANGKPSFSYFDADGRVTETVDADGHASYTQYDGDGRVTETIDANGSKTFNYYDPNGNLTEVIDADGNATDFAYDADGRKVSMTDPLHHTVTYAYDADGRLTSTTDRDGRRRDFTYDADGRLLTELWYAADGTTVVDTLSYAYDANGNQLAASNRNGTYTFTYDADGRMLTEAEPFGVSLSFSYDADGNRTSVQDSFGGTTTSAYDGNGQLTSLQFAEARGNALRADLAYDGDGNRSTVTRYADLAGMQAVGTSNYRYDADGRLVGLQHNDAAGNSLLDYTCTYDANGWLTAQTLNGTTTSYSYDATGQVTGAGGAGYSYDANGNRTLTGYQTGPGNQLLSDGTWNYSYDNEGNLARKIDPSTGVIWTYSYDNANRLVSAVASWNTDPSQGVVPVGTGPVQLEVDYRYDVFGNRIERQVIDHQGSSQNDDMRFAYDGQNAFADLDSANRLQTRRLYLGGIDQLLARIAGGGTAAWYLTDRQGTVAGLTDGAGTLQDQLSYDAFGNVTAETNPAFGDRYQYTAREWDATVQLQENRDRYYDPSTGRWISQDPLGFGAGDNNLYRYVQNAPTNATDPTGQWMFFTDPAVGSQIQETLKGRFGIQDAEFVPLGDRTHPDARNFVYLPAKDRLTVLDQLKSTPKDKDAWGHEFLLSLFATDYHVVASPAATNGPGLRWTVDTRARVEGPRWYWWAAPEPPGPSMYERRTIETMLDQRRELPYYGTSAALEQSAGAGELPAPYTAGPAAAGQLVADEVERIRLTEPGRYAAARAVKGAGDELDQLLDSPRTLAVTAYNMATGKFQTQLAAALEANSRLTSAQRAKLIADAGSQFLTQVGDDPGYYAGRAGVILATLAAGSVAAESSADLLVSKSEKLLEAEAAKVLESEAFEGMNALRSDEYLKYLGSRNVQRDLAKLANCFLPETLVGTATGLRPIAEVRPGDEVWAYDFAGSGWRLCPVEDRHDASYAGPLVTLDVGVGEVTATAFHPFWVSRGEELEARPKPGHVEIGEDRGGALAGRWVSSHDVREGDVLFLRDGGPVTVRRVALRHAATAVCNLTVVGLHTFAVGEAQVLVHNTSASDLANRVQELRDIIDRFGTDCGESRQALKELAEIEAKVAKGTSSPTSGLGPNGVPINPPSGDSTALSKADKTDIARRWIAAKNAGAADPAEYTRASYAQRMKIRAIAHELIEADPSLFKPGASLHGNFATDTAGVRYNLVRLTDDLARKEAGFADWQAGSVKKIGETTLIRRLPDGTVVQNRYAAAELKEMNVRFIVVDEGPQNLMRNNETEAIGTYEQKFGHRPEGNANYR